MDSAIRIAIIVVIIGTMIAAIVNIGVPALPEGADALIDTFCMYLREGREILNYVVDPYIINGCLACVIIMNNISYIIFLYDWIRQWFAG